MIYYHKIMTIIVVFCFTTLQILAEPMTGKQLEDLYSTDVTECGYVPNGTIYDFYCEYFLKNGSIVYGENRETVGKYRIDKKKGFMCLQYREEKETCSTYEHKSDDIYNVEFGDGSRGDIRITKGIK